jgi:hypothetical protein
MGSTRAAYALVFPGTSDRLVTLGGSATAILGAMHLMINKLIADGESMVGGNPQMKLVIPNASCGCIIGKGGATIRSFVEVGCVVLLHTFSATRCSTETDELVLLNKRLERHADTPRVVASFFFRPSALADV